jgi:hypothetical protein
LLADINIADAARIRQAYLTVLARHPDSTEIDAALTYITSLERRLVQPDSRATAWASFCHILAASNEFLYLD